MEPESPIFPSTEKATLSDLVACYRLFLNRKPDSRAWGTLSDQVRRGELTLEQLIAQFAVHPEAATRPPQRATTPAKVETGARALGLIRGRQFGLVVPLDDADMVGALERKGVYRPHVVNAIQSVLKPGMTYVDVGAGYGYFSMLAAQAVGPRGRVVCFDADADKCGLISLSADINHINWIDVRPYAVTGMAATFVFDGSALPAVRALAEADMAEIGRRRLVRGITLREALAVEPHLHVLRIAVGCGGATAVEGARHLLPKHSPILIVEFHVDPDEGPAADAAYTRLLQTVVDSGYRLVLLAGDRENEPYERDVARLSQDIAGEGLTRVSVLAYPSNRGSAWANVRKILNV
jgi:FkbM family methyltransferase